MKSWMAGVAVCLSVTAAAQTHDPTARQRTRRRADGRRVRNEDPAAARGQLLRVPRRIGDGRPARGFARRLCSGRRYRTRHRARRTGEEHADQSRAARRRLPAHAAWPREAAAQDIEALVAVDPRWRGVARVRRRSSRAGRRARASDHCGAARLLGIPSARKAGNPAVQRRRVAAHRHRSLHPRASRARRPCAGGAARTSSRCSAAPRSI